MHGETDAEGSCDAMIHQKPHTLTFFYSFFPVRRWVEVETKPTVDWALFSFWLFLWLTLFAVLFLSLELVIVVFVFLLLNLFLGCCFVGLFAPSSTVWVMKRNIFLRRGVKREAALDVRSTFCHWKHSVGIHWPKPASLLLRFHRHQVHCVLFHFFPLSFSLVSFCVLWFCLYLYCVCVW